MNLPLSNANERTRFFKFALVGFVGSIVDFGVMNLLVTFTSMPLVLAGTISFIAAVLSNFFWNRYWTFPDSRSKPVFRQMVEFTLISLVGLAIRVPSLAILEPIMERMVGLLPSISTQISPEQISNNLTLAIAISIVMLWNFIANRYWTFGDVK